MSGITPPETIAGVPVLVLALLAGAQLHGATKKAVLIGINVYNPGTEQQTQLRKTPIAHTYKRPSVPDGWAKTRFPTLSGAVADAELMKSLLISMGFTEFDTLYNQEATADQILSTLYRDLVTDAEPGDVRFVYYSGHGSIAKNRATGDQDETIVPADHWRDVPDIRDKEISRILFAAGQKGVIVTMVSDSCHSGSLSRGAWNAIGTSRSSSDIVPVEVDDPPDVDKKTGKPIDPKTVGVLYFSAAQRYEEALEYPTEDGTHGAFTWALRQALIQGPGRADLIYQRTLAFLKAEQKPQQPVLDGDSERLSKTLTGDPVDGIKGLVITADSAIGSTVKLRAGSAMGVYEGSEFSRLNSQKPAVTVRISRTLSASESEATLVKPLNAEIAAGDQFQIEKYVMPKQRALQVYVPRAAPVATIAAMAGELAKLTGVSVIEDGTVDRPTHVITWDGVKWILERHPAKGAALALGAEPKAEAILREAPRGSKLLTIFPPTSDLTANLRLGQGENTSVTLLPSPGGANYFLEGRFVKGRGEYAWVQPDATEDSVQEQAAGTSKAEARIAMPIRSDWIASGATADAAEQAGQSLTDKALRIARTHAWLTLLTPPDPKAGAFPYHPVLQDVSSRKLLSSGDLKGGTKYKVLLRASDADLKKINYKVPPRFIYVFAVDHYGKGSLIFPVLGHGNEGNFKPLGPNPKNQREPVDVKVQVENGQHVIAVSPPELDYDFEVTEPFGVDTYFVMTTEEPVANPDVFEFDGARSSGGTRGVGAEGNPLTQLLSDVGNSSRGSRGNPLVPTDWSLERLTFRSLK